MLDSFEIALYEKKYKECSRIFFKLDELRTSNNANDAFEDFETR